MSSNPSYASRAGLAIASALQLSGSFQWGVRQSAEVESQCLRRCTPLELENGCPLSKFFFRAKSHMRRDMGNKLVVEVSEYDVSTSAGDVSAGALP
ncbi:hypothetical protein AVEN_105623-1 [Araneus ventricosus]|uniref:Uncharacterized protein n=2 Tax=Araneus ventricosus TaxID=182803 RepID=A0A4Y2MQY2_ARAVE|nr:hypothetical protein AVEN_226575-1 [Araneus ventricosus]GBN27995.1 hypothetical protein AVEN_270652-1 [Araneus ventricosus]GBN28026.1 hypothetical protein AVEN_105623-1 [Araneus ventricosus]